MDERNLMKKHNYWLWCWSCLAVLGFSLLFGKFQNVFFFFFTRDFISGCEALRTSSCLGKSASGCWRHPRIDSRFFLPSVHAPPASVHEEITDRVELQAKLLRDCYLHLLGRTLIFFEDGDEGASLEVCKYQSLLLGLKVSVFLLFLFFTFTSWKTQKRWTRAWLKWDLLQSFNICTRTTESDSP